MTTTTTKRPQGGLKQVVTLSPALTKLMLVGRRAPLHTTPASVGLEYEEVHFTAPDGVGLRGWFVPSGSFAPAPAVVFVHGWLWNRLGNVEGQVPFEDKSVDFLPATRALHDAGVGVLLFDLRNHGASERKLPITYGPREGWDVQGAMGYLRSRPDVDNERIGALGCSMGANAVLYGAPYSPRLKALLAVQPARVANFNRNFALEMFGAIGPALLKSVDPMYKLLRAPMLKDQNPAIPAKRAGSTVVQYVQGTGDPWGVMEDVEAMVEATPNALALIRFESTGRYEGYRYVNEAVDDVTAFFSRHL
jgi:pimeloyl-ACP methyl ester carboxylesterase